MKHVLTGLIFLCIIFDAYSQSTNYYDRMNHIFGAIDKTKVTTGYLKEFGVRLNQIESYNGAILDTANWVDVTQWQSLYNSLYSMRVGTVAASMADPSTVFANLTTQQAADPNVIHSSIFLLRIFNLI